ncbi:transcription factor bHLH51-like [Mangifera indica]|uniref:transcription factor bHLH51-like n=1 Tax=Mangifera indica TaxID=29780 RepID=UPI001CF960DD|nr:transcription factor bHLH51-like [Mangifera indica]
MENSYNSCWPDASNLANFSFSLNNESSFVAPWQQFHEFPPQFSASNSTQFHEFPSGSNPVSEGRSTTASKSHSQAEKRRRDRINAQLSTLRKLIPKSDKMDKAALLGSVIEHVKDLKLKAMEVSKAFTIPTEVDEVTVDCDVAQFANPTNTNHVNKSKSNNNVLIKASVCCEDQPELFREVIRVLKGLGLTTVKADIATVGGRIRSILVLCNKDSDQQSVPLNTLKQSLHLVLSRLSSATTASNFRIRSKRQRLFLTPHISQ